VILGVDPGFAALGWVVAGTETGRMEVEDWGCTRTAKSSSNKVRQADDRARRIREQVRAVLEVLDRFDVRLAVVEAPPGGRAMSSSASVAIATAYALVVATLEARQVPVLLVVPWQVRKTLTGKINGGKVDAARVVVSTPGFVDLARWLVGVPKNQAEHVLDAAACLVASADEPLVRAVMNAAVRECRVAERFGPDTGGG